MKENTRMPMTSDVAILRRYLKPNRANLSVEAARDILQFDFDPKDRKRMHQLVQKAQRGTLTASEGEELTSYRRVGRMVDFMRSKARLALKKRGLSE
jgi:hypothetical protein